MATLRVMTFNIRGACHTDDGVNAWEHRAALNVEVIRRYEPDMIGLQECQSDNLAVYRRELSEYQYVVGPKVSDEDEQESNTICWKPTRLNMLASGGLWLNETPEVAVPGWGAKTVRSVNWVKFRFMGSEQEVLHINTHLDHIKERARVEGCRLILERLVKDDEMPIALTGDFNCDPGSATYRLLQEHGFVDSYLAAGNVDSMEANTFHAYGWTKPSSSGATRQSVMRIDWIMLRDYKKVLQVRSSTIVRDAQPPLYPSDHYPVVTEFEIVSPR